MLQQVVADSDLDGIWSAVECESFLNDVVLDLQIYDDALVVFTSQDTPSNLVRLVLRKVWSGNIEVHCATDLMAGAEMALN